MAFKVGDIVTLKSGGPRMTVQRVIEKSDRQPDEIIECQWFDKNTLKEASFPPDSLKIWEPDKPLGISTPRLDPDI
jgi:uncharacterized protein YodC (DUF2158 family)